ncbi:juvenile hormone epoxide hydrolase 2-like [Sitophilus oryzae]|uniref:Epoxide hydrolase n=1 Tax=Sitophilus oryzae TaxID=7048 RepID=A0A6J2Y3S1_SITOR|nr:juvenile hormone epoxide hydrolase 2-like [Sitophilus oryzae]
MFSAKGSSLSILILSLASYITVNHLFAPRVHKINENVWWGVGPEQNNDTEIREFNINVPEEVITDLKWRLKHHRPFRPSIGTANQYGTNSIFLDEFIDHWENHYNWTEREIFLNKYPQFKTRIQGLDIHFIHIKPDTDENKKVLPMLMVHGWPGSVREFYDVVDILTNNINRNYTLELVIPSLPGFGFSEATTKPGLSLAHTAVLFKKLMNRLGHEKFYLQGGDLGGITLQILSALYPESVLGYHTNFPVVYTLKSYIKPILGVLYPSWIVKPEHYERVYPLKDRGLFIFRESGYFHLQSTKPDSLGVAMDNSPEGMAAYFLEKFITGSNFTYINKFSSKDLKEKFSFTGLIDNLMLYWVTQTASSSFRMYFESFEDGFWTDSIALMSTPLSVRTAIFRSKYDLYMADGVLNEIFTNNIQLNDYDASHFPAFEIPQTFSDDLLNAVDKFEAEQI